MIRIVLVDDNVLFLNTLSEQLSRKPGIQVVGSASSGNSGLQLIAELKPDVVIVDLAMPDMTGLEVAQRLKTQIHPPHVVVVSLYDEPEYRESAQHVGVDAYVVKDAVDTDLMPVLCTLNDVQGNSVNRLEL